MKKMTYNYRTKGTCSRAISFEISDDGTVTNIRFDGGCNGNTQGVAALANGKKADEIINTLSGIRCGFKSTSCPDQLATAIKEAISK